MHKVTFPVKETFGNTWELYHPDVLEKTSYSAVLQYAEQLQIDYVDSIDGTQLTCNNGGNGQ